MTEEKVYETLQEYELAYPNEPIPGPTDPDEPDAEPVEEVEIGDVGGEG